MFLTKECDYAMRVIRALADGTKKTVETISTEEQIPKKYAYKIIKKMERESFVKSVRGRAGGYSLLKPLNTFTVLDVLMAVDSNRYVNECLREDSDCPFKQDNKKPCAFHTEFENLQKVIMKELRAKSLAKILKK